VEAGFVAELVAQVPPERLAAAFLRQQLAIRPAPEDITETRITDRGSPPRSTIDAAPRPRAERPDMTGSAWFTLSLGRRHRAEPKWILPLICKAGGITRDDVGSIRVFDEETRFEISAAKAAHYAETVARQGSGEEGVTIAPAGAATGAVAPPAAKKPFRHKGKAKHPVRFKPGPGAPRPGGKGFKSRKRTAKGV
jgi:ATP-dependent RNA helicase DeaD